MTWLALKRSPTCGTTDSSVSGSVSVTELLSSAPSSSGCCVGQVSIGSADRRRTGCPDLPGKIPASAARMMDPATGTDQESPELASPEATLNFNPFSTQAQN